MVNHIKSKQNTIKQLRIRAFLLLPLLVLGLSGCKPKENEEAQSLASSGSTTAATLASYYESLAENVEQQPELEIFYRGINSLPALTLQDQKQFEQQALALHHREQMAQRLEAFYKALQNLSSYNASADLNKSVDNLTASFNQISADPPIAPASTSKISPSDIFKPVIDGLVAWKQTRSIERGIKTIQPTLLGVKELVDEETSVYQIITARHYKLLVGNQATPTYQLCTPSQVTPEGIAEYLIKTQSLNLQFLLKQIPELQGLPWNPQAVKDPVTKCAMVRSLNLTLATLEINSQQAPQNLSKSLQALVEEHKKFLQKQPLTLTNILAYQEQAQVYIDLLKKLRTK